MLVFEPFLWRGTITASFNCSGKNPRVNDSFTIKASEVEISLQMNFKNQFEIPSIPVDFFVFRAIMKVSTPYGVTSLKWKLFPGSIMFAKVFVTGGILSDNLFPTSAKYLFKWLTIKLG